MKRKHKQAIAWLVAMVMILTIMPMAAFADGINTSGDLKDFLSKVTIYTQSGEVATSLYAGDTYEIAFEFKENPMGIQMVGSPDANKLTYQLPDNFQTAEASGSINDILDYQISADGLLTIAFKEVLVEGSPQFYNQSLNNVVVTLSVGAMVKLLPPGNAPTISFGDHVLDITVTNGAVLSAAKTGVYSPTAQAIAYTATADLKYGVLSGLTMTENVPDGLVLVPGSVTVMLQSADGSIRTIAENASTFDLSGLPSSLNGGSKVIVTYTMKVQDSVYQDPAATSAINRSVTKSNTVTFKGNTLDDQELRASAVHRASIPLNRLSKGYATDLVTLTLPGGSTVSAIRWIMTIGDGSQDVGGKVLRDVMGSGLHHVNGIGYRYYPVGGSDYLSSTYTQVAWGTNGLTKTEDGFTWTLPSASLIMIEYYTTYDAPPAGVGSKVYTNTARLEGYTGSAANSYRVAGDIGEASITKTVDVSRTEASEEYIYFTIEAQLPGGLEGQPYWLTDTMHISLANGAKDYVWNRPVIESVTVTPEGSAPVELTAYTTGGAASGPYYTLLQETGSSSFYRFNIGFNVTPGAFTVSGKDNSKWFLSSPSAVSVKYAVSRNASKWGNPSPGPTLQEMLAASGTLINAVEDALKNKSLDGYRETDTLSKSGEIQADGSIKYSVVFLNRGEDDRQIIPRYASNLSLQDALSENQEFDASRGMTITAVGATAALTKTFSDVNVAIDGNQLTASSAALEAFLKTSAANTAVRYEFTYYTRVKEGALENTDSTWATLTNRAQLLWTANGSTHESDFADAVIDYNTGLLDKSMNRTQGEATVDFTIEINKRAQALAGGAETLTVYDQMNTESLSLRWSSVSVERNTGAGWEALDPSGYTKSYDAATGLMTVTVPNRTHLRITYTAQITRTGQVTISNRAWLEGAPQTVVDVNDAQFSVSNLGISAGGSAVGFTLKKQDTFGNALAGAEFALYVPNQSLVPASPNTPADVPRTVVRKDELDNDQTLYLYGVFRTGADGTIDLRSAGYLVANDGLHLLREISAPAGFQLPADPETLFYVLSAQKNLPADSHIKGVWNDSVLSITNLRNGVDLVVKKVWNDQHNTSGRPNILPIIVRGEHPAGVITGSAVLSSNNNWTATFQGVSGDAVWSVEEYDVPSGYTKSITSSGLVNGTITFTITNTLGGGSGGGGGGGGGGPTIIPDGNTPQGTTTPAITDPTTVIPDGIVPADNTSLRPSLPQTGQNWILVWVLSAAGILLLLAGLFVRKRSSFGKHEA